MTYYAKTNTAFPGVGFISLGEVLTPQQEKALGAQTLQALVSRGVLGVHQAEETAQTAAEAATAADRPAKPRQKAGNARKRAAESPAEDPPEPSPPADAPDDAEEDDELPSLSADDLLDRPEAPKTKRGGRKAR